MTGATTNTPRPRPTRKAREVRRGQMPLSMAVLLVMPLVLLLGWSFFLPIGRLLLTSFTDPTLNFDNYMRIWEEPLYLGVIWRTIWIAFMTTLIALVLGYPVATLMARSNGLVMKLAVVCVLVPLWTSVLVRSYAWIVLLERRGLINTALQKMGLIDAPLKLLYTEGAVLIAMAHVLMPFMVLPIFSSLKAVPRDLPLAAANLGAGKLRTFISVVFPLSLPGVFAGCLIVFVMSLGFYVTPALLGGPRTLMIATLIGQQATELLNWPFAGAISLVLLVLSLGIVVAFKRFLNLERVVAND